jgi:hypothetical protein
VHFAHTLARTGFKLYGKSTPLSFEDS